MIPPLGRYRVVERSFLQITVKECDHGRHYWAEKSWIGAAEMEVRNSAIVVVPWENISEQVPQAFPSGTDDFIRRLRAAAQLQVAIAATPETYQELALHAKAWRWPTILATTFALPMLVNFLSSELHDLIHKASPTDVVEMRIIVEGDHGKSISFEYKGPPNRAMDTFSREIDQHLPLISFNPPTISKHHHKKLRRD